MACKVCCTGCRSSVTARDSGSLLMGHIVGSVVQVPARLCGSKTQCADAWSQSCSLTVVAACEGPLEVDAV